MKTLKENIEEQWNGFVAINFWKPIKKGTIEWLKQKREIEVDSPDESAQCHVRIGILNELLEELQTVEGKQK